MNSNSEDKRFDYLISSINDIQNTIRAIDTKVGFLLVFLGIPITALTKIYSVLSALLDSYDFRWWKWIVSIYIVLFVISWSLSFLAAVRVLTSIHNPIAHIKNPPTNHGTFFVGGLFKLSYKELFISRKDLKSQISFKEFAKKSPKEIENIISELIFEQMKLAYIRDIKIFRQNWAFIFTVVWLLVGFTGQITYLIIQKP